MDRVGLKCVPYPMLGNKRTGTITLDGGHFLNITYENNELDQVCAALTKILPTQLEFGF